MRPQLVLMAAVVVVGCASQDYGTHDLALVNAATPGAREALQQQLDSSNCRTKAHREAARLAEVADISPTTVAFVASEGSARYVQLDDPTKDWTRQQATGSPPQCAPAGRKHRYFA